MLPERRRRGSEPDDGEQGDDGDHASGTPIMNLTLRLMASSSLAAPPRRMGRSLAVRRRGEEKGSRGYSSGSRSSGGAKPRRIVFSVMTRGSRNCSR